MGGLPPELLSPPGPRPPPGGPPPPGPRPPPPGGGPLKPPAPAAGFTSKFPYFVSITPVLEEVANDGRSLNWLSPFRSCPTVMLKGVPESSTRKGLIEKPNG